MGTPRPQSSANRGVSGWIRKHMSVGRDHGKGTSAAQEASGGGAPGEMPDIEVADVFESTEYSLTDYEMEATGDLAYVLLSLVLPSTPLTRNLLICAIY
jgi:hypothetical protein